MNKIVKNYIFNLFYQLLVFIVPLVTAPYLTRTLGADKTGIYEYVYSLTALVTTIVMLGIFNYGSRQIAYVRDNPEELNNTFWRIMTTRLLIAAVGTAVYAVTVFVTGRYTVLFIIFYTYLLGYFVDCTWLYVGVEDMKWAVFKNMFLKLVTVFGIFLFIHTPDDLPLYVLLQGGSILLANLLAYTQLKRHVSKPKIIFKGVWNDLLQSAKLFLPSVAAMLYLQCDKIMLEFMANDSREVSFYAYSEKIILIPLSFITVISTVMMPRIANEFKKGNNATISKLLNQAAKVSLFMAFPMAFGIVAIADKLIPWYLGAEFIPTVKSIIILSPIILTNTLSGISGTQYFTASDQVGILLKSQISAALGNIFINALLIPRFGFIGAAVATVISSALCAAIQYFYLLKQVKLPGLWRFAVKYLLISALMLLLIWLTSKQLPQTFWATAVQCVIGAVFYFAVNALTKDEQLKTLLHSARNLLHKR